MPGLSKWPTAPAWSSLSLIGPPSGPPPARVCVQEIDSYQRPLDIGEVPPCLHVLAWRLAITLGSRPPRQRRGRTVARGRTAKCASSFVSMPRGRLPSCSARVSGLWTWTVRTVVEATRYKKFCRSQCVRFLRTTLAYSLES